ASTSIAERRWPSEFTAGWPSSEKREKIPQLTYRRHRELVPPGGERKRGDPNGTFPNVRRAEASPGANRLPVCSPLFHQARLAFLLRTRQFHSSEAPNAAATTVPTRAQGHHSSPANTATMPPASQPTRAKTVATAAICQAGDRLSRNSEAAMKPSSD